jgi:hypothetical protein
MASRYRTRRNSRAEIRDASGIPGFRQCTGLSLRLRLASLRLALFGCQKKGRALLPLDRNATWIYPLQMTEGDGLNIPLDEINDGRFALSHILDWSSTNFMRQLAASAAITELHRVPPPSKGSTRWQWPSKTSPGPWLICGPGRLGLPVDRRLLRRAVQHYLVAPTPGAIGMASNCSSGSAGTNSR